MSEHARWPELLLIARHGESAGNVARDAAEGSGAAEIGHLGFLARELVDALPAAERSIRSCASA